MKIGLLECDHVPKALRSIAGDYRDMFPALLPGLEMENFDVCKGQLPASAAACDGYLCTGSRFSVYDREDWILKLKAFVAEVYASQSKFIGVCFGHQMLAEALGGKVEPAKSGWNVGAQLFNIQGREDWMQPFQNPLRLLMMCRDQVVQVPENSTVLAATARCKVAMFRVGERMLGIQAHPEFPVSYEQKLLEVRREKIGVTKVNDALESLQLPIHAALAAGWMMKFFTCDV